ncbi:hypothetical protein [Pseudomonas sp. dw_358]|uniref:hypothetical protein n=1 Tax=Pseudomonas sp. dw_358 TaxID=2720083 RepID=UPI001BD432CC|nr:hypothetical protein [Pseudomonas sp. dw_358]
MDYMIINIAIGLVIAAGLYLGRNWKNAYAPQLKVSVDLARVKCADERDYLCARVGLHQSSRDRLWIQDISIRISPVSHDTQPLQQRMRLQKFVLQPSRTSASHLPTLWPSQADEDYAMTLVPGDTALFAHPLNLSDSQAFLVEVVILGASLEGGGVARWSSTVMLPEAVRPRALHPAVFTPRLEEEVAEAV